MSSDPYSPLVRSLFSTAEHSGDLPGATCASADTQGVNVQLAASVEGDKITALRWKAWGCPHLLAATEAFCAEYEGGTASSLLEFSAGDLMKKLAVPVTKTGRILVLEDVVRSLGQAIRDEST
jgi:NifU-like protein involved in Fe-S cluster formation